MTSAAMPFLTGQRIRLIGPGHTGTITDISPGPTSPLLLVQLDPPAPDNASPWEEWASVPAELAERIA